ncbi:MAG: four helix bundle protein [Bacteroidales bacterium]|nr:four helix bundle protein [Bacteroidales bacterium]
MGVNIGSVKGYYFLDAWVMANIIQLATFQFCKRFINKDIDPCGRLYDQMTQAARSVTANIAEGMSRSQTSTESQMRLLDVARASLSELEGDYFFLSMLFHEELWAKSSSYRQGFSSIKLDKPIYTDDWNKEAWTHIIGQKAKFEGWVNHSDMGVCLNSLLILCGRCSAMLQNLIASQHEKFKREGGFTENMTVDRLEAIKTAANGPKCPKCQGPMKKMMAKKGRNQGHEFWSCCNYPKCNGSRPL